MSLKLNIREPTNKHIAAIDGDIVLYKAAWATDKEGTAADACSAAGDLMNKIKDDLDVDNAHAMVYFSSSYNFRKSIWPLYKYNRIDVKRPRHLGVVKSYMLDMYNCRSVDYLEADDLLAAAMAAKSNVVCCSIDKDLLQLEGTHYNINKRTITEVTREEGLYNLAMQALTGDSVDNIKGCPGIGPKKAAKILEGMAEDDWIDRCVEAYRGVYGDDAGEVFCMNLSLVELQKQLDVAYIPEWDVDIDYIMHKPMVLNEAITPT